MEEAVEGLGWWRGSEAQKGGIMVRNHVCRIVLDVVIAVYGMGKRVLGAT